MPKGQSVRPTQDRVREAVFSSLGAAIAGSRVLDLYAGSGALGLEAWSRGASRVQWVEKDPRTFRLLKDNVQTLCGADHAGDTLCTCADVHSFLKRLPASGGGLSRRRPCEGGSSATPRVNQECTNTGLRPAAGAFDFVLADPPYDRHTPHLGLATLMADLEPSGYLVPGGILVFEQHDAGEPVERPSWTLIKDKVYGSTRILMYRYMEIES